MTEITPKKDLYNGGRCFTKGRTYVIEKTISNTSSLMDITVTNDLNEPHLIGSWWREFVILNTDEEE